MFEEEEEEFEAVQFGPALAMAMMEKLGVCDEIRKATKQVDPCFRNLSTEMGAKAIVGSMGSESGRRPLYRVSAAFANAPKDLLFGNCVGRKGLNDAVLRRCLDVLSKVDLQALHWDIYRRAIGVYGLESSCFRLDASDIDLWGLRYDRYDGGAMPEHNNHSKSKRNNLLQKEFHSMCDHNGVIATTRCYDGSTSDIEMNRGSLRFLSDRVDPRGTLVSADCKMAVGDVISYLIDEGFSFVTKVPSSFAGRIRDAVVGSALSGEMDESPTVKGRLLYDTVSVTDLGGGRTETLRYVAFVLPGGREEAEAFLRTEGLKTTRSRLCRLGWFHCADDAEKAARDVLRGTYCDAYRADYDVVMNERRSRLKPGEPCWKVRLKEVRVDEGAVSRAAEAYAVSVLVTNLPFSPADTDDAMRAASADQVVDAYLGQYVIEAHFKIMKSGMGVGHMYVHAPFRQDAVVFLTSVATMISGIVDAVLRRDVPEDRRAVTTKHISDFMSTVHVRYDRARGTKRFAGPSGCGEEAMDILRRLELDPELLLGRLW